MVEPTMIVEGVRTIALLTGAAWTWMMTLPKEIFITGFILTLIFIAYTEIEYGLSGWGTSTVLSIAVIVFVLIMLVVFLA